MDEKPIFLGVKEILKYSTDLTKDLLKRELEIKKQELKEKILFSSLERIFIENKIYILIEKCETWESVLQTIDKGLNPYKKSFYRAINKDDLIRLTEIKIKRISKFDKEKLKDLISKLEAELKKTKLNLENLTDYTIQYFYVILNKYGSGKERKSEISKFDTIKVKAVAANNAKLYVNRKDGFIGYGIKKDEFICNCSDIDDVIAFCSDGSYKIVKIQDKVFIGKILSYVNYGRRAIIEWFLILYITRGKQDILLLSVFKSYQQVKKDYTIFPKAIKVLSYCI